jgi:hypothetical protein
MKTSMKKAWLKSFLASSIIWKKGVPSCQWIPISCQHLCAKGQVKKSEEQFPLFGRHIKHNYSCLHQSLNFFFLVGF